MKNFENVAEKIAANFLCAGNPEIQKRQILHRLNLAEHWEIAAGTRILELGCGQGDTTATLAFLVGERGFVHGIDSADRDYGAPFTLGESAENFAKTDLGKRIRMDFSTDFLSENFPVPAELFDVAVLSHCAWYFRDADELEAVFRKLKCCARRLCFAEWDAFPREESQIAHALAAVVHAHWETFSSDGNANIRTLFSVEDFLRFARNAGWSVKKTFRVPAPDLDDAEWEISSALEIENAFPPEKFRGKSETLLRAEIGILREVSERFRARKCLDVFGMICE